MPILIERNVSCEMRDGVVLRANIFRDPDAGPAPVLVFRTPYDKSGPSAFMALDPIRAAEEGYVVVQQDVRGRGASEGVHVPWLAEAAHAGRSSNMTSTWWRPRWSFCRGAACSCSSPPRPARGPALTLVRRTKITACPTSPASLAR